MTGNPPDVAQPASPGYPQQQAPPTAAPQQQYAPQYPPQQHAPQYAPQQHAATIAQPIPGIPIKPPKVTPQPGEIIIGYQNVPPESGCSCDLKGTGWLVVVILILVFPFVACIPCCIEDCKQSSQVPVYGPPGTNMSPPVAQPYHH